MEMCFCLFKIALLLNKTIQPNDRAPPLSYGLMRHRRLVSAAGGKLQVTFYYI